MIPLLYGGYYTTTKWASSDFPIIWLSTFRLAIPLVLLFPFFPRVRKINKQIFFGNFLIAFVFFAGIIFQSYALLTSTASSIGFLAALFVIFTPLLNRILYKQKISWMFILPIILSLIGYFVVYFPENDTVFTFGLGELLGIGGALAIAFHMVFTERYVQNQDPVTFSILQISIAFALTLVFALIFDSWPSFNDITYRSWGSLLFLAIGTTLLTFLLQNWGQKHIKSIIVSLIVALEPISALMIAVFVGDEIFSIQTIIGGILIFGASICAILIQNRTSKKK